MKYSCNNKHEFSGRIRQGNLSYMEISTGEEVSKKKDMKICLELTN